eukprot:1162146-Pelagomonas_calceolata.AAC.5
MPGCRALKTGSFFMPVSHQSASGMSHAESVSQVELFSIRRILAAVIQTAIICRLQEWWGSIIFLLTQKWGVAQLRAAEGMVPNVQQRLGGEALFPVSLVPTSGRLCGYDQCEGRPISSEAKLLGGGWNTAAIVRLNNQKPIRLWDLASGISEAKWFIRNVSNNPILNARHTVMPG